MSDRCCLTIHLFSKPSWMLQADHDSSPEATPEAVDSLAAVLWNRLQKVAALLRLLAADDWEWSIADYDLLCYHPLVRTQEEALSRCDKLKIDRNAYAVRLEPTGLSGSQPRRRLISEGDSSVKDRNDMHGSAHGSVAKDCGSVRTGEASGSDRPESGPGPDQQSRLRDPVRGVASENPDPISGGAGSATTAPKVSSSIHGEVHGCQKSYRHSPVHRARRKNRAIVDGNSNASENQTEAITCRHGGLVNLDVDEVKRAIVVLAKERWNKYDILFVRNVLKMLLTTNGNEATVNGMPEFVLPLDVDLSARFRAAVSLCTETASGNRRWYVCDVLQTV